MAQAAPAGNIQAQIQGEISGQIAVGNYNVQIGSVHGGVVNVIPARQQPVPQPRPTPVAVRPRPFPGLLGREAEVAAATTAITAATPVEFYSAAGWGKTALLRTLAHLPAPALPDGVAYLSAARLPLADLLQCLYDTFYECPVPFKPTDAQLRVALQQKQALILLDDVSVTREEVETLLSVAPGCAFVLGAHDRHLWGEGRPLALHGLPDPAALALLERELGRALTAAEQATAAALCTALAGQPLGVIQAAARVRDGQSLEQVLGQIQPPSPVPTAPPPPDVAGLSTAEQQILAVLAAAGGATVGQEHLAPLTGRQDVVPVLEALLRRGLVQAHSPRYSLTGDLPAHLAELWDLRPWDDRLLGYFTTWAEAHQREPERVREESDAIMQTLRRAGAHEDRQAAVVRLGRAVEGPLALGAMWGAWAEVLNRIGQAAGALGDQVATAWTLHQTGTRALSLGETDAAATNLRQALAIRESLGDQIGAAVTRHNLEILFPPPPTRRSGSSQRPPEPPPDGAITPGPAVRTIPLFLKIGLGLLVVVGVLVGGLIVGPHSALTIDNGRGCVPIPAAPFPIGNIPGIAGLDTPIATGETRAVELPTVLISQLGIINAGSQFTITVGPLSYPFEVGGTTRRLLLNDAVIWERDRPNPTPHSIPLDAAGPLNLRIECAGPGLSLTRDRAK